MNTWAQPVHVVVSEVAAIAGAPPDSAPYVHGIFSPRHEAELELGRVRESLPERLRLDLRIVPGTLTFQA